MKKTNYGVIGLLAAACVLGFVSPGIKSAEPAAPASGTTAVVKTEAAESEAPAQTVTGVQQLGAEMAKTGTGVSAVTADDWKDQYPLEYESFMKNNENDEVVDYIEENPYIKTLYEGYGFAISYGSARGHTYDIEDLYATGRPHKLANCFTCKTSTYTAKVLEEGDSVYAMSFDDIKAEVGETADEVADPFGCFHCHENTPGTMFVTHMYLANALGQDIDKVPAADLSCAQCHTEYYFDPETKATTLGYHDLASMNPDDILAYENTLVDGEGNQFADWVDESTGTRKLKAQHPEFETFFEDGSVHAQQFTCADCHMGRKTAADGTVFTDHNWTSPLNNQELLDSTCSQCHSGSADLKTLVPQIQAETRESENRIGNKLADLDAKLTDAVNAGTMSEDELDEVRDLYRNSQFLWDFVFVENSEGAHNSKMTKKTLAEAEDLCDQALARLN